LQSGNRFTRHRIQEGRNSNKFYESLGHDRYYIPDVFPINLQTFVSSANRPTHPIYGDICHLRRKVDAARGIPPFYVESAPGSDIFIYNHPDGIQCRYNAATGEFNDARCDTWDDVQRLGFEYYDLGPSGMSSAAYALAGNQSRNAIREAEKARLEAARLEEARLAAEAKARRESMVAARSARDAAIKLIQLIDRDYIAYMDYITHPEIKQKQEKINTHSDGFIKATQSNIVKLNTILSTITNIKDTIGEAINNNIISKLDQYISDINKYIANAQKKVDKANDNIKQIGGTKRSSANGNGNGGNRRNNNGTRRRGKGNNNPPHTKKAKNANQVNKNAP
jgi:hypothetical protein